MENSIHQARWLLMPVFTLSVLMGVLGSAALNFSTYCGISRIRASITSSFTGVSVLCIDIEPVEIDDLT